MKKIQLRDIWPIDDVQDYKVHFGCSNKDGVRPLDEWVCNSKKWEGWQKSYLGRNDFNRAYIFSLMDFYPEKDIWLFGGIFRVIGLRVTGPHKKDKEYEVEPEERGKQFIGRLKLRRRLDRNDGRARRVNLEGHYDEFVVSAILAEPYSGRTFPGYEGVDIPFGELESLMRRDRSDWKTALASVNGVYLITDENDDNIGKHYVGSAYGEQGLWGRWKNYVETGHGGNQGLRRVTGEDGVGYARRHFRFTLLDFFAFKTPKEVVLSRETFWKEVLLTRGKYGLNEN